MGCTRLKLVGMDAGSNEPLDVDDCVLVCNGMIYNYRAFSYTYTTHNDCEVIIHLYRSYGACDMMDYLDGVFAFVLYDKRTNKLIIGRDALGIRPLFMRQDSDGSIHFSSESPCLFDDAGDSTVTWIEPGTVMTLNLDNTTPRRDSCTTWWNLGSISPSQPSTSTLMQHLSAAVTKRMLGERPIGALLSGGIDSSTVAAILAREMRTSQKTLQTFSIGLADSPDLVAARTVAAFIHSDHHEVVVTAEDMIAALPDVMRSLQTFCVTTIRASTPMWLLCKYIAKNTDVKILFNGDVSDEIFGSYAYFAAAPSSEAFYHENARILKHVYKYDVLRSDRCTAAWGLDARTPFADKYLVDYVMGLPASTKQASSTQMEKQLLRKAVSDQGLLPDDITWRSKTAFSDGISHEHTSWHTILQHHFDKLIDVDDPRYQQFLRDWNTRTILTQEAFYYTTHFPNRPDAIALIGKSWMPRFVDAKDPSARTLS